MSALAEKPNAEPLPPSSGAAILQDGHYLPPPEDKDGKVWVRTSTLVQKTPDELYAMWRAIENAPLWQEQLEEVVVTGPRTSKWTAKDGDEVLTWTSEILADEPAKRIAWRTVEGDFDQAGEVIVEAAPGDRGTYVIALMAYKLAAAWESFSNQGPKQRVIEDLRHFKALAETGEIPHSQSTPTATEV